MAQIVPFRAWRYNPQLVELSQVVTQPYDKITPEMQERYYTASPYNLVRIILGKHQSGDDGSENVYTRAAGWLRQWREQGVLLQDGEASIYGYVQNFQRPGTKQDLERRGFIALGRIEDYSANVVHRHEQTLAKPKADRLELLRATRAHFGQLFMLYSDPQEKIDRLLAPTSGPQIDVRDEYGVRHCLWCISHPDLIQAVQSNMTDKQLIIADGHHRYETALNYRNERRANEQFQVPDSAPYEMVMMTFINMDNPALVILPTHRIVHGLSAFDADNFRYAAREYFSVEEVDPAINEARAHAILREAGQSGTALLAVTADRVFLLDTPKATNPKIFAGLSLRQQSLDVLQLHKCLLEGVLGISEQAIREQKNVSYLRDIGEALARVRGGQANIAFLINPVRMQQVRDLAFAGEVLPQKSTDFYPKLLSGLTIYALE
jgi:uncharacterized protein (DUF1015 family)